jgi:hypothetical protein
MIVAQPCVFDRQYCSRSSVSDLGNRSWSSSTVFLGLGEQGIEALGHRFE